MDYSTELKELLRPLGIYNVDSGLSAAELNAVGAQLTGIWQALETAERESNPVTAQDRGLSAWEALLPFVPAGVTPADRARAIAALLRIDRASFTLADLNDTVAGCGIRARVEETAVPMTVKVSFPYNRGTPENFAALQRRIEQILPCHLAVVYAFVYLTWGELESLLDSWASLEAEIRDWNALERYGGEA